MSGSRFVVLKGEIARLERAIGQFMLDLQTAEHGYTGSLAAAAGQGRRRCSAPASCRSSPKTCSAPPMDRWLIPTAEVSLTNIIREQITPRKSCRCA
jgi:seryl-tRNA synthetase